MPNFSFLNDDSSLEDVMEHRPDRFSHFALLSQSVMRGQTSELTASDRDGVRQL